MQPAAIARVNCIVLEGADARRFAQAQFAGNVGNLLPGHWQWNAWLDAQGRVRALMHLVCLAQDRLLAMLRGGEAEAACADLERFRMRLQVDLGVRSFTGLREGALTMGAVETCATDTVIGYGERSLRLSPQALDPDLVAASTWRLADIRAGWPSLPAEAAHFLPPALGLERLGAVCFDKGCYPGQEIAARLHFRGGHKHRLCHVRGPMPLAVGAAPQPSDRGTVWVLACSRSGDAIEALIVGPSESYININILGNLYDVISTFNA